MTDVVATLWGFCHTLRHDGIGYGHYVEQLTYLLFLKMAGERDISLPKKTDWAYLRSLSGTDLLDAYVDALRLLGRHPGLLSDIFSSAQSRFSNPVNLKKLISLIDETDWTALDVDVKAAAFEGLLERAASEGKKGAGQYFTPRLLIKAIVRCMKPDPRVSRDFKIDDPACGTGGFLVSSYEWLLEQTKGSLERDVAKRIRTQTYFGQDIDPEPRRLAVMNLYLHQVEPHIERRDSIYETPDPNRYDVVLMNPPLGLKGANQGPDRDDFTVSTSNKQLNFIQHVLTILKPGGRAAVVVPENVLFADQAGEVFQVLMEDCSLHTVLRLPRGTFSPYSEGIKTNVIFFQKGRATERTWIFDARANVPKITKKDRPLTAGHFSEFERCYGADPTGRSKRSDSQSSEGRWRSFSLDEVKAKHYKLDALKWLRDEDAQDADDQAEHEEIITDATEELRLALDDLAEIQRLLEGNGAATNQ
jgi:type I restriction enzyme M protein